MKIREPSRLTPHQPAPIFGIPIAETRWIKRRRSFVKSGNSSHDVGIPLKSTLLKIFCLLFLAVGCSQQDPVKQMQETLAPAPDYTIILEDMQEEGAVFTKYYHKYHVLQGERQVRTDWVEVTEDVYRKYEPFLGMALVSKSEAEGMSSAPHPPGYHHVGNPTYGHWGGGGFWVWYGQYSMMRTLLGGGMGRNIYRNDYDDYRTNRRSGRPYYGKDRDYGTNGKLTKQQRPNFYKRRQANLQRKKSSFSQKAQSRFGRSRSGFGGRSGGFGK